MSRPDHDGPEPPDVPNSPVREWVRGPIPPRHQPTSWELERVSVDGEHRESLAGAESAAAYEWAAALAAGRDVLDVGCGTGTGTAKLAAAGARSVTGLDSDTEAIRAATDRHGELAFAVAAGPPLPIEDHRFGLVLCFDLVELSEAPEAWLGELCRVLAADGALAVSLPTVPALDPIDGTPLSEPPSAEGWRELLAARLGNVELYARGLRAAAEIGPREATAGTPELVTSLGAEPAEERAVLALASAAELPAPPSVAVLTAMRDLRAYRDTLAAWEQRARRAEAEGSAKHWELVASRESQRRLRRRLHQLEHRPLRMLWRLVRGRPARLGHGPPIRASERDPEPWD